MPGPPRNPNDDEWLDESQSPQPSDYRVVPTELIPNWHTPFRCSAADRWPGSDRHRDWSLEGLIEFERWLADHPEDMARCWYHRQWFDRAMGLAILAMRSVRQSDTLGQEADGEGLPSLSGAVVAILQADSTHYPHDVWLAGVLVAEPIIWVDGLDYLTDGQHRMCALRAAGVPEVLVCSR